jgi:hypothetical protein
MTRNGGDRPPLLPWRVLSRRLAYDASPWLRHWVEAVVASDGVALIPFPDLLAALRRGEVRTLATAAALGLAALAIGSDATAALPARPT